MVYLLRDVLNKESRQYRVHLTSVGECQNFRDSDPNPAKNAGQVASSASGGFVCKVPPLPVTPAVRQNKRIEA
jgi:hypothetical protein